MKLMPEAMDELPEGIPKETHRVRHSNQRSYIIYGVNRVSSLFRSSLYLPYVQKVAYVTPPTSS